MSPAITDFDSASAIIRVAAVILIATTLKHVRPTVMSWSRATGLIMAVNKVALYRGSGNNLFVKTAARRRVTAYKIVACHRFFCAAFTAAQKSWLLADIVDALNDC